MTTKDMPLPDCIVNGLPEHSIDVVSQEDVLAFARAFAEQQTKELRAQLAEAVRLLREAKDYLDRWEARPSLQLAIDAYLEKGKE